ncbi:MAG: hypothetical protein D6765_06265, partial [Bacteroidetes bacterium]
MSFLRKFFLALAVLLLAGQVSWAQKKITKGVVKYEITDIDSESPEVAMLKGSELELYFLDDLSRMVFSLMGGLVQVQTITNAADPKNPALLLDLMGQKIQLTGLGDNLPSPMSFAQGNLAEQSKLQVTYHKKDKKKIAGYKCCKAVVRPENGVELAFYVTKKIKPKNNLFAQSLEGFEGFPLEYIIETPFGISVTLTATEVLASVQSSDFDVPKGYRQMTLEEF